MRHQGMLLSPVVMVERYAQPPPAARFPLLDNLRNAYNRFVSYLADLKENADRDEATILKWVDALLEKYVECGHGQIAKQHDVTHQRHRSRANWQPHRDIAAPSGRLCRRNRHEDRLAGDGRYFAARWPWSRPNGLRPVLGIAPGHRPPAWACSPTAASSG